MFKFVRKYTKPILIAVILLFVISCFAMYGFDRSGRNKNNGAMRDYPVAEANGKNIMRSELEKSLGNVASRFGNVTSEDMPMVRMAALKNIVIEAELKKDIEDKKVSVSDQEIDAAYKEMMDRYPTREEFIENMKRTGQTEEKVKAGIKEQLELQKVIEEVSKGVKVEDAEAQSFYDTMKNVAFKQPAGVKTNMASFSKKESAEAAQAAIASGTKWDEAVEKYKEDIVMSTPYDQPVVITNEMMARPAFKALKGYGLNVLTKVEDAGEGVWYIAIKRSDSPERIVPFDEVSADVKGMIQNQKAQNAQVDYFNSLYDRAKVKILDESIFPQEKAASADSAPEAEPKSADK